MKFTQKTETREINYATTSKERLRVAGRSFNELGLSVLYLGLIPLVSGVRVSIAQPPSALNGVDVNTHYVLITCSQSAPFRRVKWYHNNNEILVDDSGRHQQRLHGNDVYLSIKNVTKVDLGEYICQLDDRNSSKLSLKYKTKIFLIGFLKYPKKKKFFAGDAITVQAAFKVLETVNATVTVLWKHFPSGTIYKISTVRVSGVKNASLSRNVTLSDNGEVVVRFTTSDGAVARGRVRLKVYDKLPTPDSLIKDIGPTWVSVFILFPERFNGSYDSHIGFHVKIASDDNGVTRSFGLNSTTRELNITELIPCTNYSIRIHAVGEYHRSKARRMTVRTSSDPSQFAPALQFDDRGLLRLTEANGTTSRLVCLDPSAAADWHERIKLACNRNRSSNHSNEGMMGRYQLLTNTPLLNCSGGSQVKSCDEKRRVEWSSTCSESAVANTQSTNTYIRASTPGIHSPRATDDDTGTQSTEYTSTSDIHSLDDKTENGKNHDWVAGFVILGVCVTFALIGLVIWLKRKFRRSKESLVEQMKNHLEEDYHLLAFLLAKIKGKEPLPRCCHATDIQADQIANLLEGLLNSLETIKEKQDGFAGAVHNLVKDMKRLNISSTNIEAIRNAFGERIASDSTSELIVEKYLSCSSADTF
ncbi:uncharacterized protein [Oscarella lobularis]|uniref:uncharacterized protein isoform X2 n=1 Tax=Oscarella lobularis TaxID=121494 RepID=UPI003313144C